MTNAEDDRLIHLVAQLRECGLEAQDHRIVHVDILREIPKPAGRISITAGAEVKEATLFQRLEYSVARRDGHVRQACDF